MTYSGAAQAKAAREALGKALEALQQNADLPADVLAVAQNVAKSVGALFEAERASSEPDGKACIRNALGSLSQTLALLQDVRGNHPGVNVATEVIAQSMSKLYPLTTVPSKAPPPMAAQPLVAAPQPQPQPQPQGQPAHAAQVAHATPAAVAAGPRTRLEANIGATTESNFYVGFSGEIAEGGVFLSTYEVLPRGSLVQVLVTLPGGFETQLPGKVQFVRDPLDFAADSEPGMGIKFEALDAQQRELILRFIRKRAPIFYDE